MSILLTSSFSMVYTYFRVIFLYPLLYFESLCVFFFLIVRQTKSCIFVCWYYCFMQRDICDLCCMQCMDIWHTPSSSRPIYSQSFFTWIRMMFSMFYQRCVCGWLICWKMLESFAGILIIYMIYLLACCALSFRFSFWFSSFLHIQLSLGFLYDDFGVNTTY